MRSSVLVAFAAFATIAASTPPEFPVHKDEAASTPSCPGHREQASALDGHVDLSGSGLTFDPRAPGGARPMESGDKQYTPPVNPASVTLFPAQQPEIHYTTKKGTEHEHQDDCRP